MKYQLGFDPNINIPDVQDWILFLSEFLVSKGEKLVRFFIFLK